MYRRLVMGLALVVLVAGPLSAQNFVIGPRLGYVKWKAETGLKNAAMLGVDATYQLNSNFGLGVRFDVAKPGTDGNYFPAEMQFGLDSTLVFAVSQPVTLLQYGVQAVAGFGDAIGVFFKGGAGGRTFTLDPQAAFGRVSVTDWAFSAGAGVKIRAGAGTSITLEVQDLIYPDFARESLNTVEPRFRPTRFPDVVPYQAEYSGTAHNIYAAIAFSFTPGGAR
jgi:hypothetical protein